MPTELSRAVSHCIEDARAKTGISARQLILQAGLKPDRGYDLLNGAAAWSIPELEAFCRVLEKGVSATVRKAETLEARRIARTLTQADVAPAAENRDGTDPAEGDYDSGA